MEIPSHLRRALRTMQRCFEEDNYRALGTFNELLQPVADAAVARIMATRADNVQLRAEVERLTADLATARRLLPPRYVAADGSILDPERCTPHAPDCAECGRGRAHDEGCLALLATPAEEAVGLRDQVERLTAALEEARRSSTPAASAAEIERTHAGWVSGASMEHGTITVKIDGDPESVAGVHIGVKARALLHLHPYPWIVVIPTINRP